MKNHNHNLIHQLSESLDSLWRCERHYKEDAQIGGCDSCVKMWEEFENELRELIGKVQTEIAKHVTEGKMD